MTDTANYGWTYPSIGDCDWGTVLNQLFVDADCDLQGVDTALDVVETGLTAALANRMPRATGTGGASDLSFDARRYVQLIVVDFTTEVDTDDVHYLDVPNHLDGLSLVEIMARHITAGNASDANDSEFQLYNVTKAKNMLSTVCHIDQGETSSLTAGTAAVFAGSDALVNVGDLLKLIVVDLCETAPEGLIMTLGFS